MGQFVIIIGSAKSGTSSLFSYIEAHSEVVTPGGKEPHYFCDGFYKENISKGIEYESLWDERGSVLLEATTNYTKFPCYENVPENMRDYGLEPKFIYIVRDPIDRFKSHIRYMTWLKPKMEDKKLVRSALYTSMYATQMEKFLSVYPNKNKYFILTTKELDSSRKSVLNEIFDFIGIEGKNKIPERRENESVDVTDLEISLRGSLIYEFRKIIPTTIKNKIRSVFSKISSRPYKKLISSVDEKRIVEMIKDAKKIEEMFDIDTSDW